MTFEMTVATGRYSGGVAPPTRGASRAARYVAAEAEKGREHLQSAMAFGLFGQKVFEDLCLIFTECKEPGWDGYHAEPVSEAAFHSTAQFLRALPLGMPVPTIGAEADGQLTLEWYRSPRRTLSVSVSADGELHYAALIGASKAYGTEPFFGEIPEVIMNLIVRIMAA
ncbi:hypothetical protein [Geoalkalibacter halelectricus]|uniref:Uncharacterized protein n=1 Tax=Geoalkalibacter halelectricus TaxID=2847045 RepID=A0ABY5ZNB9_9BACT|nr:hypothetical protein [Geoalkalibacter halelectricus]MDO3378548.1 hypothetical protein [Geoalkalibacter halelectricus]UWZ80138.1 hypothetical protein L9S41_01785 [Geoalkalibacter halelectricus]